ncbi:MAG: TIGR00725 family protein [Candidatus Dormibacteraeota bacterium]|nr:TIGR00725 family protein [Candidatus Dormibacteraeota bacterium]
MKPSRYVAVCGASEPDPRQRQMAREVGKLLAEAGAVVLCGGLGGVMEAASEGATTAGGAAVGLLPGADRALGNPHLTLALATGLGEARNAVLTCAAESVIAIGCGWGTLSEIALARKLGREVVCLDSWQLEGVPVAASPEEAVKAALGDRHDSPAGAKKGAA